MKKNFEEAIEMPGIDRDEIHDLEEKVLGLDPLVMIRNGSTNSSSSFRFRCRNSSNCLSEASSTSRKTTGSVRSNSSRAPSSSSSSTRTNAAPFARVNLITVSCPTLSPRSEVSSLADHSTFRRRSSRNLTLSCSFVADHFTYALQCKRNCTSNMGMVRGKYYDNLFPRHYQHLQKAYYHGTMQQ